MESRQDSSRPCENRDSFICKGVNGFKSVISQFRDGTTTTSSSISTTPLPSIATTDTSTLIVTSTSVLVQQPTLAPSFVTSLPTVALTSSVGAGLTQNPSFISSLPTGVPESTTQSATLAAQTEASSAIAGIQAASTSTSVSAPTTQQLGYSTFPVVLVAVVVTTIVTIIIAGIVLWYFCLRHRLRRRSARSDDDKSIADEIYRHVTQSLVVPPKDTAASYPPSPPLKPASQAWRRAAPVQRRGPPSVRTVSTTRSDRSSFAGSEATNIWTDFLTPRPATKQTIHRISVPAPVEVRSLRGSLSSRREARAASLTTLSRSSSRDTGAPDLGKATSSSSGFTSSGPEMAETPLKRISESAAIASQQDLAEMRHVANSLDVPVSDEEKASTSGRAGKIMQYTVRKSPLAQNPFIDPGGGDDDESENGQIEWAEEDEAALSDVDTLDSDDTSVGDSAEENGQAQPRSEPRPESGTLAGTDLQDRSEEQSREAEESDDAVPSLNAVA